MLNPLHVRASASIAHYGGTLWRTIGDSYLITFDHADAALECVVEIQQGLAREPISCVDPWGATWTIRVRVGIHSAESEVSLDDLRELVGTDVNFAARILTLGRGGQIIVSDGTRHAAGRAGALSLGGMAGAPDQELRSARDGLGAALGRQIAR